MSEKGHMKITWLASTTNQRPVLNRKFWSLDPWSPKNPGHFEIWALKFHFEQKKPQSASTFQTCNLNVICIWVIVIDVNKDCKQLIANLFKMFGAIRRTDLWNIWHLISTSSPELFPKHEQFVSKIRTDFN